MQVANLNGNLARLQHSLTPFTGNKDVFQRYAELDHMANETFANVVH